MPAFGMEISERTIKYIEMKETKDGLIVERYGIEYIPSGVVEKGQVVDGVKLTNILDIMRKAKKIEFVRISIPEEQVYTFQTEIELINGTDLRDAILLTIEGFIPVPAETVEFDYDILSTNANMVKVQVAAAERSVIDGYLESCTNAGMQVISCEYECQALGRAVTKPNEKTVAYLIDMGHVSTTCSVVQDGIVVSSSTISHGGEEVTLAISKEYNMGMKESEELKHKFGMNGSTEHPNLPQVIQKAYAPIFDEIIKQYNSWLSYIRERSDLYRPIDTVQIVGTEALTPGFIDLFQSVFHKPVSMANVWTRIEATSTHVPKIHFEESLIYGTAIGLALAGFE